MYTTVQKFGVFQKHNKNPTTGNTIEHKICRDFDLWLQCTTTANTDCILNGTGEDLKS